MGSSNDNDSVIECVSIGGQIIELNTVSHDLQRQYRAACAAVGRGDKARAALNDVGARILAEKMPDIAIKAAPVVRGDHAVMAKLLRLSR